MYLRFSRVCICIAFSLHTHGFTVKEVSHGNITSPGEMWATLATWQAGKDWFLKHLANHEDFDITLFIRQSIYLRSHPSMHPFIYHSFFLNLSTPSPFQGFSWSNTKAYWNSIVSVDVTNDESGLFTAMMGHMFHCVFFSHGWVKVREVSAVHGV